MLLFNYGPGEHSQFSDLLRAGWSRDRILVGHCYYMSFFKCYFLTMCRESVISLATRYGLDGPGIESWWGVRFSAPVQTGPGAHPASCTMGTGSFPGVKSGRGMTLTLPPLPVMWSRKSRAIPRLPLWAVQPVQSLSACTRVRFTFAF